MKRIFLISLISLFYYGCAQYSIPPGVNLNRYSYVAMIPLTEFKETGTATRADTIAIKEYLSKLFQKEGFTVLPDYSSILNLPPEERLKALLLSFSYNSNYAKSTFTLMLGEPSQNVFSCTSEYSMGMTQKDDLFTAIRHCFSKFRNNYSGFDQNLANAYVDELKEKFKNWEKVDVNEATLRDYLDKNISTLDPIEGIWMLDRPGWPHYKMGILKDRDSPTRDFISVRLEESAVFEPGHVLSEFQKTASMGAYVTTSYQHDGSKAIFNSIIDDNYRLAMDYINTDTGESISFTHIKVYPHNITVASKPEIAPSEIVSQGTGFAVSSEGHIVTVYHVIKNAKLIKVYLSKDSFVSAKMLHGDPVNDLAVLKIENATPNFLQLAPMRSVKTGDRVFTIGFPVRSVLGQEPKYTEGVVSSLSGVQGTSSFLQITVPIQPGNSGGALVNERGEVIGIITSTVAILPFIKESGTLPQNVNWAVKADYLKPLIELPKIDEKHLNREQLITLVKKSTFFIETE